MYVSPPLSSCLFSANDTGMFAFVFYCILCQFFPLGVAQGIFAGITLGYVCYDCLHYYVHHTAMPTKYLQNLKVRLLKKNILYFWSRNYEPNSQVCKICHLPAYQRYHLDHHFKNNNCSFGISSRLYDHIFDTLPDRLDKE